MRIVIPVVVVVVVDVWRVPGEKLRRAIHGAHAHKS